MRRRTMVAAGLVGLVIAGAAVVSLTRGHGARSPTDRPTPSGLPVPRYVSLKFDAVNARAGPGDDHRLLFVFHARGLPVQVVAETSDWRRVCDPDGGLSWVHRRTTDGKRTVMGALPNPAPILAKPQADAPVLAYLAPRALAAFERCRKDWCAVRVGSVSGWTRASALWGVSGEVQCR
jgi:SH3-like domain-containing protein